MITPTDLTDFALHASIAGDRGEATEVAARRAVSAAYYALFHDIAQAGAALVSGSPALRSAIARSYSHSALEAAARKITPANASADLFALASSFIRLRLARERADYDLETTLTWAETGELVDEAVYATNILRDIRRLPETAEFLLAPLIKKRGTRG